MLQERKGSPVRAGLVGYDEYAAHVRYRLIPHVWWGLWRVTLGRPVGHCPSVAFVDGPSAPIGTLIHIILSGVGPSPNLALAAVEA